MEAADLRTQRVCAYVERAPISAWSGDVWRCHAKRYLADDFGGSLKATGRFHRGSDQFEHDSVFPALYSATSIHIALAERIRHTTPQTLALLANQRVSRLAVRLSHVIDLRVQMLLGVIEIADICRAGDYAFAHAIAIAARARGVEAILVESCTLFRGGNLIIFPDLVRADSSLQVLDSEDPELVIDAQ